MSEYPDFYPPFMRDFHDQKDTVKAFYAWLHLLDEKHNRENPGRFDKINRPAMCRWPDFVVLLDSFLDFAHQLGYSMYKTRGVGKVDADPFVAIKAFKDLDNVLYSLIAPDETLSYNAEYCIRALDEFSDTWKDLMNPDAIAKYRALKDTAP